MKTHSLLAFLILIPAIAFAGEKAVNLLDGITMQGQHFNSQSTNVPTTIKKQGWQDGNCPFCKKQNLTSHYIELVNGGCSICDFSLASQCSCERGHYWYQKYMTNGIVQVGKPIVTKAGHRMIPDTRKWVANQRNPVVVAVPPTDPVLDTAPWLIPAPGGVAEARPPTICHIPFRRTGQPSPEELSLMSSAVAEETPPPMFPKSSNTFSMNPEGIKCENWKVHVPGGVWNWIVYGNQTNHNFTPKQ
jgi:hypothetical protein